ncbi:kinase-like protein [Rhizodiscina lignyota]|uniref:Kinase-like protein n=1 Tax=Rhizodiscina lignyota TaxID=1504668 RepID=A0A9P4M684_9PEZI|nr:kinase-like protein [Rhizodiscina lignyota]
MATASPTPISYGAGRLSRAPSTRLGLRHASPLSVLSQSQGFTSNVEPLQHIGVGDSSDDDMPQMPKLSGLTQAMLDQNQSQHERERRSEDNAQSPRRQSPRRQPGNHSRIRISRNNTPKHDSTTPAPSIRVKRTALQGAPMRRNRRTPQGDEEQRPPSQDQENIPVSIVKPDNGGRSVLVHRDDSVMKPENPGRQILVHRDEKPIPLAQVSANTPMRPAPPPPPPPKMSILETATAVAGAGATKQKRRRGHMTVNGKTYTQLDKIGKGGSGQVYRVMAENGKLLALKRVKLDEADEAAILGYKGEIELLKKLQSEARVIDLYDWQVDEEKQCLSVLLEMGDTDLSRVIRSKNDADTATLDLPFTRYYWREMLSCVAAVHAHEIVHSDLKPANFLLVQGQLKLIDFGIAGAIDTEHTVNVHRDNHVGTPNYMSPESLQDSNAKERQESLSASQSGNGGKVDVPLAKLMRVGKPSDVWSLGCILYQMTYGRPPFAHIPNPIQRVMAIINPNIIIEYPATGIGGIKVPPALKRTLRACLNRDPTTRPTIAALLDERDEWLYPDSGDDLRISEELLGRVIQRLAERFWESDEKGVPTREDIEKYPAMFYSKLRMILEEGHG